jgi:hypothetical protein
MDGDRKANLEHIAQQFDRAKAKYMKILIEGLSDPDPIKRLCAANFIRDNVVPTLQVDPNPNDPYPKHKELSLQTLQILMSELRPPHSEDELFWLDKAVFYYLMYLMPKLEGKR